MSQHFHDTLFGTLLLIAVATVLSGVAGWVLTLPWSTVWQWARAMPWYGWAFWGGWIAFLLLLWIGRITETE